MSDLILHEEYARAHLDDHTAWLALADHHTEYTGLPYRAALRAVLAMRRQCRDAADLAAAAKCIAAGTKYAPMVRLYTRHAVGEHAHQRIIVIVPGQRRPRLTGDPLTAPSPTEPLVGCITVGARWLIECAAEITQQMDDGRIIDVDEDILASQ